MYSKIASHQFVEPTDRTTARPVDLSTQLSCVFLVAAAAISWSILLFRRQDRDPRASVRHAGLAAIL